MSMSLKIEFHCDYIYVLFKSLFCQRAVEMHRRILKTVNNVRYTKLKMYTRH